MSDALLARMVSRNVSNVLWIAAGRVYVFVQRSFGRRQTSQGNDDETRNGQSTWWVLRMLRFHCSLSFSQIQTLTVELQHAQRQCFQYGKRGHVVRDCPSKIIIKFEEKNNEATKQSTSVLCTGRKRENGNDTRTFA
jgi:hypothetical protein